MCDVWGRVDDDVRVARLVLQGLVAGQVAETGLDGWIFTLQPRCFVLIANQDLDIELRILLERKVEQSTAGMAGPTNTEAIVSGNPSWDFNKGRRDGCLHEYFCHRGQ